jgi:hypothetical protein
VYENLLKQLKLIEKLHNMISYGVPAAQAKYDKGDEQDLLFITSQLETLAEIEKLNEQMTYAEVGMDATEWMKNAQPTFNFEGE